MDSLAETDHIALQEETNVDDRHDIDEQETADDASPSVDEVGDPQQLSYALLNLTEQNAWDDIMSQLVTWEAETAVALDLLQDEAAPLVRRLDPQEIFTLLRPVQALCEKIEDYPRLIQVHSDRTPGLLQRLCLGEPAVLSRLFVEDNFGVEDDDAFEIVKRLVDQNPEALLWTKALPEQGEEQGTSAQAVNTPILKDLVETFPRIGLYIFDQHRSILFDSEYQIFDSEYQGDLAPSIVTHMMCKFGCSTTIDELVFRYPQSRLFHYESQYPIQVINGRVYKTARDAYVTGANENDYRFRFEEYGMLRILSSLLKPENGVTPIQFLTPPEQDSAALSLMWGSLVSPLEPEDLFFQELLEVVTTIILKQRVSTPTFNFQQFASFTKLHDFSVRANQVARHSPSMFKFLKTMLRIVRVNDFHLEECVQELDVVSHLIPLIDKEFEIEQEYVKLRQVRAILAKISLGSESKQEGEDESEDSPLVGFVQGLDGWAKERLEGCPLTSHPHIRAIRAEMKQPAQNGQD